MLRVEYLVYSIGVIIALALILFVELDQAEIDDYLLLTAVTAPLATILLADKISNSIRSHRNRKDIIESIRMSAVDSGAIAKFNDDRSWVDYMIKNASRAKIIYNTRLSPPPTAYENAHREIDKAIADAVRNGTHYFFICSENRSDSLPDTITLISKKSNPKKGSFTAHLFYTDRKPIIQVKIFDYGDYKEALIGFVFQKRTDVDQPIFLIRSEEMIRYFMHVFESYMSASVEKFPIDKEGQHPPQCIETN